MQSRVSAEPCRSAAAALEDHREYHRSSNRWLDRTGPDLVVGVDSDVPQRTRRLFLRICIACSAAHTVTAECAATREGLRFASDNRRRRYRCMGATWGGLQRSEVLTEWPLTAGWGTMAWELTGAIPVCLCSSATRDRADSHRPSGHQC